MRRHLSRFRDQERRRRSDGCGSEEGSWEAMAQREESAHLIQWFSDLLFLLLFKLQETLFKKALTPKPSMEVGIAGHLSLQVARGGGRGSSRRYTLEKDGPGGADPKFHKTSDLLKEPIPNRTRRLQWNCDRPGNAHC